MRGPLKLPIWWDLQSVLGIGKLPSAGLAAVLVWSKRKQDLQAGTRRIRSRQGKVRKSQDSDRGPKERKNFTWNTNLFLFFFGKNRVGGSVKQAIELVTPYREKAKLKYHSLWIINPNDTV